MNRGWDTEKVEKVVGLLTPTRFYCAPQCAKWGLNYADSIMLANVGQGCAGGSCVRATTSPSLCVQTVGNRPDPCDDKMSLCYAD